MDFKRIVERFLYITVSLFLMMLMIVFSFGAILAISSAMMNFTINENYFMGFLQFLVFAPVLGGLAGMTRYIRKQYFSFHLFEF